MSVFGSALPLIPDGDEARDWAERELSRPEYAEAQPTPIDRIAQAIRDFIADLFGAQAPEGLGTVILIVVAVALVVAIVVTFILWGRPRAIRRSAPAYGSLFGEDDRRTARELRDASTEAAAREDWDAAIVLRFRAVAVSLVERDLVDVGPGTTARTFAARASAVFPAHAIAVRAAADTFDDVRYLRRRGTRDGYGHIVATDDTLAATSPARQSVPA